MAGHQLGCESAAQLAFSYFASLGFGLAQFTASILFMNVYLALGALPLLFVHVNTSLFTRTELPYPAAGNTTTTPCARQRARADF
jgi:hypothetical protein